MYIRNIFSFKITPEKFFLQQIYKYILYIYGEIKLKILLNDTSRNQAIIIYELFFKNLFLYSLVLYCTFFSIP